MKNIDFTPIIQALITFVAMVITVVIIPKVKQLLNEKLTKEQIEKLKTLVDIAVEAAEQIYGAKNGDLKKQYVYDFLIAKGIKFDFEEVSNMIESKVYNLSQTLFTVNEATMIDDLGEYALEDEMTVFAEEELVNGKEENEVE